MNYDSDLQHRRSICLRGYDYRRAGAYYFTIRCAENRSQLFLRVLLKLRKKRTTLKSAIAFSTPEPISLISKK
ncbi:MAG: hypothetical protein AB4426_04090 [Xenococcaceae cyanobacterium]